MYLICMIILLMEWQKQLEIPILFLYVLIVNMKVVIGVKKVRIFYLQKKTNNNRFVMYFNIDRTSRYCYKTNQIYSMLYGKTTI